MADIRIKDLTTTASSTASDDFIAVDGATNGTRKLNAYSPSFGGNATVGGTLTVNNSFGVGAAPTSSWASGYYALEVGNTSTRRAALFANGDNNFWLVSNAYFDGSSFKRFAASSATGYEQVNGEHKWSYAASGSAGASISFTTGMTLNSSGNLQIAATTASTSTSTGALVVSGGVGVAGALYVGSKGQFQSNDDALSLKYSTDGGACLLAWKNTSGTTLWSIGGGIDTRQDELVFRRTTTTVLNLDSSNNATFAGNIKTAAPAGGTAAAWKLGTVASVSPTSPNRTIEVDIGGTIYYIHAKTTNN